MSTYIVPQKVHKEAATQQGGDRLVQNAASKGNKLKQAGARNSQLSLLPFLSLDPCMQ